MKITVDIDCTPKELRASFGLPDVEPLQRVLLEQMEERLEKGLQPEDVEQLMQLWMSGAGASFEQMQKMFWSTIAGRPGSE